MSFKYAIALTGGIGSGKSTVVTFFKEEGFCTIDADKVAHEILDKQHKNIAKIFGKETVNNEKVERKILGKIIFSDKKKREDLESLLHPLIYKEIEKLSAAEEKKKQPYFIDIPLFFETRRYKIEKILVVCTTKEKQLKRVMHRDGYNKEDALKRVEAQMPIEAKCQEATYTIDNNGTLGMLRKECIRVRDMILGDFDDID